jgi:hypothetical protein
MRERKRMSKQIVMWAEDSNDYYAKQMSGGMWEVIHCTDGGNYVIGYTMQPVIYMDACIAQGIDGSKVEKINPEPTDEPAAQEPAQPATKWFTDPITTADGESITARVTYGANGGGNLIEVLANGMHVWGESETVYGKLPAQARAREMATAYFRRCNYTRAIEMGDEAEAANWLPLEPAMNFLEGSHIYVRSDGSNVTAPTETPRIKNMRAKIARLQSEMDSLKYELSQELGEGLVSELGKDAIKALRWLSGQGQGASFNKWSYCMGALKTELTTDVSGDLLKRGFIDQRNHAYNDIVVYNITDAGRAYLESVK